jgi:hypothetical protein
MLRIQYNPYAGPEELRFDDVNFVQPKLVVDGGISQI